MIKDLTSLAQPLKNHSKFKETAYRPKFSSPAARLKEKRAARARGRLNETPPRASTPVDSQEAVAIPGVAPRTSYAVRRTHVSLDRYPGRTDRLIG